MAAPIRRDDEAAPTQWSAANLAATEQQALLTAAVPKLGLAQSDRIRDMLRRAGGVTVGTVPVGPVQVGPVQIGPAQVGSGASAADHTLDLHFGSVHEAVTAAAGLLRLAPATDQQRHADDPWPAEEIRAVVLTAVGGQGSSPRSGLTASWAHRLLLQTEPGCVLTTSATAVIASATLLPGFDFVYRGLWRPAASEQPDRIYQLVDRAAEPSNLAWARRAVHGLTEDPRRAGIGTSIEAGVEPADRATARPASMVTMVDGTGARVSACLAEVAIGLHAAGWTVLHGSWSDDPADRYGAFSEAFGAYASRSDRRQLVSDLEGHAQDLARLLPEVGALVGGPHLARPGRHPDLARLCDCLETWLRHIADRAPVVLVLDQAQWMNTASIMVLTHLAQRLRASRVRFILGDVHRARGRSGGVARLVEHLGPDLCTQVPAP